MCVCPYVREKKRVCMCGVVFQASQYRARARAKLRQDVYVNIPEFAEEADALRVLARLRRQVQLCGHGADLCKGVGA